MEHSPIHIICVSRSRRVHICRQRCSVVIEKNDPSFRINILFNQKVTLWNNMWSDINFLANLPTYCTRITKAKNGRTKILILSMTKMSWNFRFYNRKTLVILFLKFNISCQTKTCQYLNKAYVNLFQF